MRERKRNPEYGRMSERDFLKRLKAETLKHQAAFICSIIFILMFFASFIIIIKNTSVGSLMITIGSFVLALACSMISGSATRRAEDLLFSNALPNLLSGSFEEIDCDSDGFIPEDWLRQADLFGEWNRCDGYNYIKGRVHGALFEFSNLELVLERPELEDGDDILFDGQWFICELSRSVGIPFSIRTRSSRAGIQPGEISSGSEDFDDSFQVASADPEKAFKEISPELIESALSAKRLADEDIYFYFIENRVHIAVASERCLFDKDSVGKAGGFNVIKNMRSQIHADADWIAGMIKLFID